jgi:hypothetical protein
VPPASVARSSSVRGQDIEDYGIDAHVEPFDGTDRPTGHLLALQIKSGARYIRERTDDGWWYRGANKHLRYWLSHVLPVLVVVYEPASKTLYWQHITEERIEYTDEAWKILIPRDQVVRREGSDQLQAIADSARGASEDPLANSLPLLPPSAAAVLRHTRTLEPDGTVRIARWLADRREQPRLTAVTVLAAQPSWLSAGNGMFEAAIGAYANEHGHRDVALNAFERAAEYGSDETGRLYGVAMVLAIGQGDPQRAAALARRSGKAGCGGLLLSVARAALADHEQGQDIESPHVAEVLAGASAAEQAAEPNLMVLLGGLAASRAWWPSVRAGNCRQVVSVSRLGAGGIFKVLRILRMADALTRWQILSSSPGSACSPRSCSRWRAAR